MYRLFITITIPFEKIKESSFYPSCFPFYVGWKQSWWGELTETTPTKPLPVWQFLTCLPFYRFQSERYFGFYVSIYEYSISLEEVLKTSGNLSQVLLVSDSKSALSAIYNVKNNDNPIISQIYLLWKQLCNVGCNVSFLWCPSHCGIKGNEIVDTAAQSDHFTQESMTLTPDDLKPLIQKTCINKWQNSWNNVVNNKLKFIKPDVLKWKSSSRPSRYQEVVLTRLRIGHTRLTHSFIFTRTPVPTCECGEPLTIHHIIITCPIYNRHRQSLVPRPTLSDCIDGVDSLMSFLRTINMLHLI